MLRIPVAIFLVLSLAVGRPVFAEKVSEKVAGTFSKTFYKNMVGATDAELTQLLDSFALDPAAPNKHRAILEKLSPAQMAQAIESTGNSHFTWMYPMILRAQDYPTLIGLPIGQLSVLAIRGDKLLPIPFQIDEFDARGLVYPDGTATPGSFDPGLFKRQRKPDGIIGRYDHSDELVFMYRDAGLAHATPEQLAAVRGTVLGIIALRRDGLPERFVYLMQNQPMRSNADYVRVDIARGTAKTTFADIEWDPDSLAMIRKISPRVGPARGKNIVDGVYGEVSTGILQKNLRVSLNTRDNIRVQPVAVRDGPVRALMLIKLRIFYVGVPILHDFINVALYEQSASLLSRVRFDSLNAAKYFVAMIKDPRIEATIDFAGLPGAEARWQSVNELPERAMVDGRMSAFENILNSTALPGDWMWLDSKQGWHFFFSNNFAVEPGGLMETFLEGMTVQMLYEDSPAVATREGMTGAGPRLGIKTSGLPHVLVNFLGALRGTRLNRLRDMDQIIGRMITLDEKGKLDRLNQNINLVHQKLIHEGKMKTLADMAELLVLDIRRIGFKPADQEKLVLLARRSILEGGTLQNYRLGPVLQAMRRVAKEEDIDLEQLRFAMLDNTLWFPDTVGAAGPAAFDREIRRPPVAVLLTTRTKTAQETAE